MNTRKLAFAEKEFLQTYPGGFEHPEFDKLAKKHRVVQMTAATQVELAKAKFADPAAVAEQMVKLISKSSMVSLFEKPKFRDTVRGMGTMERDALMAGLKAFLHGSRRRGFESMVAVLAPHKLAKWSLLTVLPYYYRPHEEVLVKPTTAKDIIQHFELNDLTYRVAPTWDFYERYRAVILDMKARVDPSLAPNNAAFCGFLMMSMGSWGLR